MPKITLEDEELNIDEINETYGDFINPTILNSMKDKIVKENKNKHKNPKKFKKDKFLDN